MQLSQLDNELGQLIEYIKINIFLQKIMQEMKQVD